MIAVSNTLKQACDSERLFYKEYIVIDSTTIEIKGKMSNTAYKNTTFFGTFNLKMLEFTTENDINYKKKTFTYWKSVNGEAFKIGSYIVTDIKDNDSTEDVTITAMDYGLKFATPYTTSLNYASGTVTLYDVLQECCLNVGVELENSTIANGDFIVDSNQFVNGEQNGTVIANIAGICGDFATINESDKLELVFYKKTETIDSVNLTTEDGFYLITEDGTYLIVDDIEEVDDYISLDDKRDTQPITCMSLGFSNIDGEEIIRKDNDLIALYGENWLRIDDNYFAYSTAKMNLLIDNIFNKVKGFGYSSFVTKYSFKPYLQLGDMIYFKNKNGAKIRSVIFKIDTDYDDITLSAPSITNATVEYERPDDALTIAKNAQISVDRANSEILLKVSADEVVSSINLSPDVITLTGNRLIIDTNNFALTKEGIIYTKNTTYNRTALKLQNESIFFYDWKDAGETLVGRISSSIKNPDSNVKGIAVVIPNNSNKYFSIGVGDGEVNNPMFEIDSDDYDNGDVPYIRNTGSGTMFPNAGGIIIKNGLIKTWNLSTISGTLFTNAGGITVNNGLITDWNLSTISGTLFPDAGGITVKNGLITASNIRGSNYNLSDITIKGIQIQDGLVTGISYIQD